MFNEKRYTFRLCRDKGSDAYLCYQCDGKAVSLHKLQQSVSEVQNELLDKLKELHEFMTT